MMSGPLADMSAHERLRRSFAVWGLAIFGSFSGSGAVMLDCTTVWATDDTANGLVASSDLAVSAPPKSPQHTLSQHDPSSGRLTRGRLFALLHARRTAEAVQRVDAALAVQPTAANYHLSYILANHLIGIDRAAAEQRLTAIVAALEDRLDESASSQLVSCFAQSAQLQAILLTQRGQGQQALVSLDQAARKLTAMPASMASGLWVQRCRILIALERAEEAKAAMDQFVVDAFHRSDKSPSLGNRMAVPAAIGAYASLFRELHPKELQAYRDRAEQRMLADLENVEAGPDDFLVYQTLQIATALEMCEADPRSGHAVIVDLQEREAQFKERLSGERRKRMLPCEQTLKAALAYIQSAQRQQELIGQPAPELEIGAVVNREPVQWTELRGKVVLLDFWAVWSGPCLNTLPDLRRLQSEYGERGLVIIGLTRAYRYTWDPRNQIAVPSPDASLEEELAMLEQFRKHHELDYGFIVMPPDSDVSRKFGSTGIPQAVLVDQNGIIQLIRVGASEKNASAIEAKIKELLAQAG